MKKLETIIAIVALLPVGCLSQEGSSKDRIEPSKLQNYLPPKVSLLVPALTEAFQKSKTNVADSNDRYIRRAKEDAVQWIFKTIRKDQLPPDPDVLCATLCCFRTRLARMMWPSADGKMMRVY